MNHYQYVNTSKRQQLNGKSAAVIRYDEGSDAPKVVAQGRGQLANHIINLAKEHQVDMQEDSTLLANLLGMASVKERLRNGKDRKSVV